MTRKSTLLYKLNIRILTIFFFIALSICILVSLEFFFSLKKEYVSKGSAIATSIADSAADFLVTKDISLIQDYINQFQLIEGIKNIFLTDEKNILIAHTFSPIPPFYVYDYISNIRNQITFNREHSVLFIQSPILNSSLGYVYIEMDLTLIFYDLMITILELISIIFLIGIIGLFLLSRFTNSLLHPINKLSYITAKMSQSDFNLSEDNLNTLTSIQKIDNEIGSFSRDFSNLYQQLQDYLKELTRVTKKQASLDKELSIAKTIQMNLLGTPISNQITQNISVSTFLEPAKFVGGDFYDIQEKDDLLFISIGDVSGKGVSAALFMAATLTAIRSKIRYLNDPSDIMTDVNAQLCDNNENMLFVTVFFAVIHKTELTMTYINAGHPPPYLINETNLLTELPTTNGIVLGIDEHAFFQSHKIILTNNSFLVMYTDGLTEAQNTDFQLLGDKKVKQWCVQKYDSTETFQESLISQWNLYCNGIDKVDDCTLVIMGVSGISTLVTNPIKLHFTNDIQELIKLQHVLALFCSHHNMDKKYLNEINIVLEELISNIIYYGYDDHDNHLIYVSLEKSNKNLSIAIEDDGKPFNPLEDAPNIDLDAEIEDRSVGGLGIHIVKNMVTSIHYNRIKNTNILTIKKELS